MDTKDAMARITRQPRRIATPGPEHTGPPAGEWVTAARLYSIFVVLMDGGALVVELPQLIARTEWDVGLAVLACAVIALPLVVTWITLERAGHVRLAWAALVLNAGYAAGFAATLALCLVRMRTGDNTLLRIVVPGVPVSLAYALNLVALLRIRWAARGGTTR